MGERERVHKVVNLYGGDVEVWREGKAAAAENLDEDEVSEGVALSYLVLTHPLVQARKHPPVSDGLSIAVDDISTGRLRLVDRSPDDPDVSLAIRQMCYAYLGHDGG